MDGRRLVRGSALLLASLGAGVLWSGCLTRTTGTGEPTGRVTGTVLAGPTCPVVSAVTDGVTDGCDPVPVEGKVQILRDGEVIGEVTIGRDGSFSVDVPLGSYMAKAVPASTTGFPVCSDVPLVVEATGNPPLAIDCDTGIR